jgi:hypothetical protein
VKRVTIALIIAFGFLPVVFSAPKAFACSCSTNPSNETFENSAAVFIGTVTGIEHSSNNTRLGSYNVQFSVEEAWKGISDPQTTVITSDNDGTCGYDFQQGIKYLVYAYGSEESLQTGICNRTQPVADAYADLVYLGKGYVPVPGQPIVEKTPGSLLPFIGIGAVVAAGIAFFTLQSRRR